MTREERKSLVGKLVMRILWLNTQEGQEHAEDKDLKAVGIIRTAILFCFDEAADQGIPFIDMLKNALLCCAGEHGVEIQTKLYAALEVLGHPPPYGATREELAKGLDK